MTKDEGNFRLIIPFDGLQGYPRNLVSRSLRNEKFLSEGKRRNSFNNSSSEEIEPAALEIGKTSI